MSDLKIVVYRSGFAYADIAVQDAIDHEGLIFTTMYPGGIYGTCSFFIPRKSDTPHDFVAGYRVAIFDGLKMIWEGQIDVVTYISTPQKDGIKVDCTGYYGTILKRRRWDKIWCDTRITADKWVWSVTAGQQEDKYRLERYNRIRFTPIETDFIQYDDASVIYTLPTGQTINRIEANYAFSEGTQTWGVNINDVTHGTALVNITSSGTSTFSGTPAADCTSVGIYLFNGANLTYDYDNDVYAEFTDIKVYTEAGTPTATEIVKDIRAHVDTLSSDESWIGDNLQAIEPAFMEGETIAEFLTRLAGFGDTSLNPWAAGVMSSKEALSGDYKPVLYFKQQPDLTDYEYSISLEEIEGGCQIEVAYDEIANWIILEYTDENSDRVRVTPDDDANLKDTTSIAAYGQRDVLLRLGSAGVTEAKIYARRYLAWYKDPHYRLTSPIVVKGSVRQHGSGIVPVHEIRAGFRIQIDDYLQEIGGSGIIFLITGTRYDETSGRMTITAGSPNPLEVLATRQRGVV